VMCGDLVAEGLVQSFAVTSLAALPKSSELGNDGWAEDDEI